MEIKKLGPLCISNNKKNTMTSEEIVSYRRNILLFEGIESKTDFSSQTYRDRLTFFSKLGAGIEVALAHVEYTKGKTANNSQNIDHEDNIGHCVVVVRDKNTKECKIINFNSVKLQNINSDQPGYITGGPLAKNNKTTVPDIKQEDNIVTLNLQGNKGICGALGCTNFKAAIEFRIMEEVYDKFLVINN